jgi:hypothetical protein
MYGFSLKTFPLEILKSRFALDGPKEQRKTTIHVPKVQQPDDKTLGIVLL